LNNGLQDYDMYMFVLYIVHVECGVKNNKLALVVISMFVFATCHHRTVTLVTSYVTVNHHYMCCQLQSSLLPTEENFTWA